VANFGINLDLRLNGQTAVDRAVRGAKALEDIVNRINNKPLNLANIGGAARFERLSDARKKVIALAKAINKGTKDVGKTEVAVRETLSAFSELAANTEKNTSTFKEFTAVVAKAEKELNEITRATENVRRAQKGMMSLEEREAQLERRANILRDLRTKRKLKDEETRARNKNEKAIERENKRLEKQRKLDEKAAKRRKNRAIGDLAASVGFPLLFGGGVGSVAGGAIGSLAGSALGIGFGGQILGSALGQALDQAAQAANEFALAATKGSTSLDALVSGLGIRGTQASQAFGFAGSLGISSAARQAAQGSLESIVGKGGVENLEKLAQSSEDASNALSRFGAATSSFFAPLLTGLNQGIAGLFGGISPLERQQRAEESLANLPTRQRGSAARRNRLNTQIETLSNSPEAKAQLKLEEQILSVVDARVGLAKQATDIEKILLTSRRDTLATNQGDLAIQEQQNKLDVIAIQLAGNLTKAKRRELELEQRLTKEAKQQAEEAKRNAQIQAQRAIDRDISTNEQAILRSFQELGSVQRASLEITELEEKSFSRRQTLVKDESKLRLETLDLQREQELVGKNEQEVRDRINEKFDLAVRLEKRRVELQLEQNRQAEILRQNREQEIKDNRELVRLESERNAKLQIRSMDFGRKFELAGAGLGFFGESENFQEETFARTAAQLEAYNEQIAKLQERIEGLKEQKVDPDVILGEQFKLDDLVAVRNAYEQLQPQIDAAAVAQARFNDAMGVAVPVTDSLFDNLMSVVEGTQTAREAFASFLRDVASLLRETAKQMIAQYIAIGIAKAFAFGFAPSPAGSQGNPFGSDVVVEGVGGSAVGGGRIPLGGYAQGGYISGPTRALVGEGGEPEYVIPESKMRESMARYSRGARGSAVIPDSGASGTSSESGGVAVAAPIDVRYTVERINSVDYVTADQFQRGLQQAAAQGATQGEQRALTTLRQNTSQRRRIGL
jgi:hypothetical protein